MCEIAAPGLGGLLGPRPGFERGNKVKGDTSKKLVQEIEILKTELAQLEEEEERIKVAKKLEADKAEQQRRRAAQQEEEIKIRDLIELRKVQEEQRKDRLKKMREEARLQEAEKLKKEKEHQQAQWDLTVGATWAQKEAAFAKKQKELEDNAIKDKFILDAATAESRHKLAACLETMKKELSDLSSADWEQRSAIAADFARQESFRKQKAREVQEKNDEKHRAAMKAEVADKLSETKSDLVVLQDELRLLEREDLLSNLKQEAMTQTRKEAAAECTKTQEETFKKQRERQVLSDEQTQSMVMESHAAGIDCQEYLLARQIRQKEIAEEQDAKRVKQIKESRSEQSSLQERMALLGVATVEEEYTDLPAEKQDVPAPLDLRTLREEQQRLFEEELRYESERFQKELETIGSANHNPNTSYNAEMTQPIQELLKQQRSFSDVPIDDIIKYSTEMAGIYTQMAADDIEESRKRLRLLREEQMYHHQQGLALKDKAKQARDEEERQFEEDRRHEETAAKERRKDADAMKYERDMREAQRETDEVHDANVKCRQKLLKLQAQDAEIKEKKAIEQQAELESTIRMEECRLIDASAAKRRATESTAMLRKAAIELEKESALQAQRELEDAAHQNSAATVIQGLHKIRSAKKQAEEKRATISKAHADEVNLETAILTSQAAYRQKEAMNTVQARREEIRQARQAKARDLLKQLEAAENLTEEAAVREEIRQEIDSLKVVEHEEQQLQQQQQQQPQQQQQINPVQIPPREGEPQQSVSGVNPDDKLADLEYRVTYLQKQMEDEKVFHKDREHERAQQAEEIKQKELSVLNDEKELQSRQIDELSELLSDHTKLITELQRQLDTATRYGPYEEDWERGEAASKIQAIFKGYSARKTLVMCFSALADVQQERKLDVQQNEAAAVIQGMSRTSASRRHRAFLEDARQAHQQDDVAHDAAVTVQRVVRGKLCRNNLKRL